MFGKRPKTTNLTIRFSTSETIYVAVKVYVAKSNVSSSKIWDMVTLKFGDHNLYDIKSNNIKLFYIEQVVNGKKQIFYLLLNRRKLQ